VLVCVEAIFSLKTDCFVPRNDEVPNRSFIASMLVLCVGLWRSNLEWIKKRLPSPAAFFAELKKALLQHR
jgi:hypothetical protein